MNGPNRTPEAAARAARKHVFVSVKSVWAEILAGWAFDPVRGDQAIHNSTVGLNRADWVKVETRYGSSTVRVVLLKGNGVLRMWTLQSDGTRAVVDRFLREFEAEMAELGIGRRD